MGEAYLRRAWADVDLKAIERNAAWLVKKASPAVLCAVVKADGYGHGAVPVARAALEGGATWLAVAMVEEGVELRKAGIEAPIIVFSEPPPSAIELACNFDLDVTAFSPLALGRLADFASKNDACVNVHLKVDTGMHRIGVSAGKAVETAKRIVADDSLNLKGVWTHLAVADVPDDQFTDIQLDIFRTVLADLRVAGIDPGLCHAANSAGSVRADALFDMVRCGIALYGYAPSVHLRDVMAELEPAMEVRAEVSHATKYPAGTRVSYGRRRSLRDEATVATLPLGYADGVPWRLFESGGEALVGGHRVVLAGAVTMDQILLDCGPENVQLGQEAVLIGRQGDEIISAQDWANRLGTIVWEILSGIGSRLQRRYSGEV